MNFLSHFYFDRFNADPNLIMGGVLPDLVKNASKTSNLYPQKNEFLFSGNAEEKALLEGWKRHLWVDQLFHSSDFFMEKTSKIKQGLIPVVAQTPVRPSFLAHISLELLLDHLLINHNYIQVNHFYENLNLVNSDSLRSFLEHCNFENPDVFLKFLAQFISSKYLFSYQKMENISYALNRICMRIWPETLNEIQIIQLSQQLEFFKVEMENDFMTIFDDIESSLNQN